MAVGTDYKVKVTSIDSSALNHESAADFSVVPEYIIKDYTYFEPFDTLTSDTDILPYKYAQLSTDDHNWTVLSGPTPSRIGEPPDVTGPMADHTTGGEQGIYLYTEASAADDGNPNKKFDYTTPKFDFQALVKPMLSFWYHMFSDNAGEDHMGELHLDICVDGQWQNDVITAISGNKGDNWLEQTLDLIPFKSDRTVFRFRGITGDSWESDISIDDIMIWDDGTPITNVTLLPTSFDVRYFGSRIHYQVPENAGNSKVRISLYNLQGKLVKTLLHKHVTAGRYTIPVNKLATGMYLCRMEAKGFVKTINVLLTK